MASLISTSIYFEVFALQFLNGNYDEAHCIPSDLLCKFFNVNKFPLY